MDEKIIFFGDHEIDADSWELVKASLQASKPQLEASLHLGDFESFFEAINKCLSPST